MEKKGLMIPVLFVFLINFVSAQFYGGFTDFLYNIDPNAMTLGVLFIVLFAILFFSLSRIFKDKYGYPNKTIATVVALALSVLCVYWVNRTGFDIAGIFYGIGISKEILYIIAPLVVLAGLIFLFTRFKKKRFGKTLLILGGLLLVLSFTDLVYEKGFLIIVSIIMIIVGLVLTLRRPRGPREERWPRQRRPRRGPRGPPGSQGPIGPVEYIGREFGTTPSEPKPKPEGRSFGSSPAEIRKQVKERIKRERRAEKEEQKRLAYEQKRAQIEQRQQKQIEQKGRLQITSNLQSLIETYNEIQRQNPSDPRLIDIAKEVKRLKREKR